MTKWRDFHINHGVTVGPLRPCQVHSRRWAQLWTITVFKSVSILQDVCALGWKLPLRIMAKMRLTFPFTKLFTGFVLIRPSQKGLDLVYEA